MGRDDRFNRLLRFRIVALTVCAALLACVTTAVLNFSAARERALENAHAEMTRDARLFNERISEGVRIAMTDAAGIEMFPPIAGLQNAVRLRDTEPGRAREEEAIWRDRLQRIFHGLLEGRAHYTQIRLIGQAGGWRELVRVDRRTEGIYTVKAADLQVKGAEPYLEMVQNGQERPYFSDVTLNREHGVIDGGPTLRLVHPVLAESGAIFAVVVINVDYIALLELARPADIPGRQVTISNAAGGAMQFRSATPGAQAILQSVEDAQPDPDGSASAPDTGADRSVVSVAMNLPNPGAVNFPSLTTTVTLPSDTVMWGVRQSLMRMLVVCAALTAVVGLVAWVFAWRLTHFLDRLTLALRNRMSTSAFALDTDNFGAFKDLAVTVISLTREQEAMSQAILSSTGDGIIAVNEDSLIELANDAAAELFGYEPGELLNQPLSRLMDPDLDVKHQALIRQSEAFNRPRPMLNNRVINGRRRDGSLVPLDITISAARYSEKWHYFAIIRDATERLGHQELLEQLVSRLEKSNSQLDDFTNIAAHDLRSPLRVIHNSAKMLEDELNDQKSTVASFCLDLIGERAQQMDQLLDELLNFSRLSSSQEPENLKSGAEILEAVLALIEIPTGFDVVATDRFRSVRVAGAPMITILMNLVSNAVRHHDKDRGMVRIDVNIGAEFLSISVSDDGPGIDESARSQIFDPFVSLARDEDANGHGIGLALVGKLVIRSGGRITCQPTTPRGTIFIVDWPREAGALAA
ncbi:sensor histidine kinase [Pseudooceanicola sp. C21-150M6]|uniref:sensor histidine kinase n=1 Tax=Pseudooceanicola sp. C21-150M6 TaxID=3434355 RepID=UPI003D7FC92C